MSDTQATPSQPAIDHLVRLLQMNPIHHGTEIIDARRAALGLAKEADATRTPPEDMRALRRKVIDQIESLRSQFWAMPVDDLNQQLGALDSGGFVDLEASIARVRVVAAYHDQFPALSEKPGFDGNFFAVLKDVLIRSPRDTSLIREQILSSFRSRSRRKRGRRMIALIKAEMPAIYELESDWFDTLYRQKPQRVTLATSSTAQTVTGAGGSKSNAGSYWWVLWIAIGVSSSLFRTLSNDKHSNHDFRTPSIPSVQNYQFKPLPVTSEEEQAKGNILLGRGKDGSEIYSTRHGIQFRPGQKARNSFRNQEPVVLPEAPNPIEPSKKSDDQPTR